MLGQHNLLPHALLYNLIHKPNILNLDNKRQNWVEIYVPTETEPSKAISTPDDPLSYRGLVGKFSKATKFDFLSQISLVLTSSTFLTILDMGLEITFLSLDCGVT